MFTKGTLAAYKGRAALVRALDSSGKIEIETAGDETLRVREKDLTAVYDGVCAASPAAVEKNAPVCEKKAVFEAAELLDLQGAATNSRDVADLVFGEWSPEAAWGMYAALQERIFFTGTPDALSFTTREDAEAVLKKRNAKEEESALRAAFLERLRALKLNLPDDARFMQDVESLARGESERSRTLRDIGISDEGEGARLAAHRLLLDTGVWDAFVNPYPAREGCALSPPAATVPPPSEEARVDLTHLAALAIDSPWSHDPDDALSVDPHEPNVLYVHVADPAAVVAPESAADIEARNRGATLYLPETTVRLLADAALDAYALRPGKPAPALTFKITLDEEGAIAATEVMRSRVVITCLTYEAADECLYNSTKSSEISAALGEMDKIAVRNLERRRHSGAVFIDFPEVHLTVRDRAITIEPLRRFQSDVVVREAMLLAGEAAAGFALRNKIPFPFVSQDGENLPADVPPGLAGSWALRKCMKPRTLSAKPGLHFGLGLSVYSQVTSPLRRYTDLLAHQQLRAFLAGTALVNDDEILARLARAERGSLAAAHAERASRAHWTAVYCADKRGETFPAVYLGIKGAEGRRPQAAFFIPDLALETYCTLPRQSLAPNDEVSLKLLHVRIPEAECVFSLD